MPKSSSVALKAHFAARKTTYVTCWKGTLQKNQPKIASITKANPGVVTTDWAHSYLTGDVVRFYDVEGMTELNWEWDNGKEYIVTFISTTSFSIDQDTSGGGFSAYTAGGEARKVLGFTEHVADLLVGKVTHKASTGYNATAVKAASDLSVDNLDLQGVLDSEAITAEDILRGVYDNDEIEIFLVNYKDLTQGKMVLRRGNIGEITTHRSMYVGELRGLMHHLQQNQGQICQPACRADLGDRRCKVRLDPPVWQAAVAYTVREVRDAGTGSVVKPTTHNGFHFKASTAGTSGGTEPVWNAVLDGTTADGSVVWTAIRALTIPGEVDSVTDTKAIFAALGIDDVTGWYRFGKLTWITGANIGISIEVKESTEDYGETTFELFEDMPFDIVIGDTFEVTAGCDKIAVITTLSEAEDEDEEEQAIYTPSTCAVKYDNGINFRGEPYVPGQDKFLQTPDARA